MPFTKLLLKKSEFDHKDIQCRSYIGVDDVKKTFTSFNTYQKDGEIERMGPKYDPVQMTYPVKANHPAKWTKKGYEEIPAESWPQFAIKILVEAETPNAEVKVDAAT
jgi:hypothetical protein